MNGLFTSALCKLLCADYGVLSAGQGPVLQIRERPMSTGGTIRQNQQKMALAVRQEQQRSTTVSLAMAKVQPYLCFIAVVIQYSCLNTCH